MKYTLLIFSCLLAVNGFAQETAGLTRVESAHDVATTGDRLEAVLGEKGMKVFARINHAKGAASAGIDLAPTELIIFGNPKVGAPLQQCARTVAIDLPQKALIWQDDAGKTWIGYNDPAYLKERHNIGGCDKVLTKVTGALKKITSVAAAP